MKNIAIYIFNHVEVLDFAGPFEVFSTASRVSRKINPDLDAPFEVFTLGETQKKVTARGGLSVAPSYAIEDHPPIDVLVIPGGIVNEEMAKPYIISWISSVAETAEITASVCTGAFLLGKAGLLKNKKATTHWEDIADLRALLPDTEILENIRWIDEGRVLTSAGISAGIDMSLYIVSRQNGKELAEKTARQMEYDWRDKEK